MGNAVEIAAMSSLMYSYPSGVPEGRAHDTLREWIANKSRLKMGMMANAVDMICGRKKRGGGKTAFHLLVFGELEPVVSAELLSKRLGIQ